MGSVDDFGGDEPDELCETDWEPGGWQPVAGWDQADEDADVAAEERAIPDLPERGPVSGWRAFEAGREIVVTIELPTGQVYQGKGMMAEIVMDQQMVPTGEAWGQTERAGLRMWEMTLRGMGDLRFEDRGPFMSRIRRERSAKEWLCRYCGGAATGTHCPNCGAARTVLLE